jgi:ribosome modulation factor
MRAIGKSKIVESGYLAGRVGIKRNECALAPRSVARKWWIEGWRKGWAERHAAFVNSDRVRNWGKR